MENSPFPKAGSRLRKTSDAPFAKNNLIVVQLPGGVTANPPLGE
jgi:hypothetical protein